MFLWHIASEGREMTTTTLTSSDVRDRVARLVAANRDFIPNASFRVEDDRGNSGMGLIPQPVTTADETPAGLPAHLQAMCDSELLTFEQEQSLFKAMNYRKFLANELWSRLDPATGTPACYLEIESLLMEAQSIRDHIIKANMRLVISIVKKFVTTRSTFDEMLSDGLVALMNCVGKFDFDRGFRFSTYAYRSIARDLYRSGKSAKLKSALLSNEGEEWAMEPADERGSSAVRDGFWSNLRDRTGEMIQDLDRRERFIIRCRYALGSHRKVKSLQFLADKLGVSKERVRQLEIRAVKKLRNMANDVELDDVVGSAVI